MLTVELDGGAALRYGIRCVAVRVRCVPAFRPTLLSPYQKVQKVRQDGHVGQKGYIRRSLAEARAYMHKCTSPSADLPNPAGLR